MIHKNFSSNIFINCPFDDEYLSFRNALIFTIYYCGFIPRCALEQEDSGNVRYEKIIKIINECQYGIHDISRTTLDSLNQLPRFNMPFELGLFLGAKKFGNKPHKSKNCLILDVEKYRYQKFISDISGNDIQSHKDDCSELIKVVRNWLANFSSNSLPGGSKIYSKFQSFERELPAMRIELGLDLDDISYNDYSLVISEWLKLESNQVAPTKNKT